MRAGPAYKDGHAERDEVRTGINDGQWVEVTNLQRSTAAKPDQPWVPVTGSEKVILGDLSILADGGPVEVAPDSAQTKVAGGPSGAGGNPEGRAPTKLAHTP